MRRDESEPNAANGERAVHGALDIARAAAHGGELGIVVVTTDWRCARNPKLRRRATALARCMYAWMTLKTLRSRLHPANLPGPPLALVPYKVT